MYRHLQRALFHSQLLASLMQFKRRSEIVERQELLRIQPSQTNGLSAPAAAAEVPDSTMLLQFSAETWTCVLK